MSPLIPGPSRRVFLAVSVASLAACGRSGSSGVASGQNISDPVARRFYALRGGRAVWDPEGAQKLSQITAGARAHGLDPAAFVPKRLAGLTDDEALTVAALAYAKALASGFVDPRKVEHIFTLKPNDVDVAAGLSQALDRGELDAWYASLPPQDGEYKALSAAYQSALGQSGLASAPANSAPVGRTFEPAEQTRQLAANLERRRWLNRAPPAHRIDVNTAAAFLDYFKPGEAAWATRTVVGRDDHPSPSIEAAFHRLIANPPGRSSSTGVGSSRACSFASSRPVSRSSTAR